MSEYLDKREKVLTEHAEWLSRFRRISKLEAWQVLRSTFIENLRDSVETQMEDTWRIDRDIIDRRIQIEAGFAQAERRWQ